MCDNSKECGEWELSTSAKGLKTDLAFVTHRKLFNYLTLHNGSQRNVDVAARSKVGVCGRWLAGIAGSNPAGSIVSVLFCEVEVSDSG